MNYGEGEKGKGEGGKEEEKLFPSFSSFSLSPFPLFLVLFPTWYKAPIFKYGHV
jgi:hypothetical protein